MGKGRLLVRAGGVVRVRGGWSRPLQLVAKETGPGGVRWAWGEGFGLGPGPNRSGGGGGGRREAVGQGTELCG